MRVKKKHTNLSQFVAKFFPQTTFSVAVLLLHHSSFLYGNGKKRLSGFEGLLKGVVGWSGLTAGRRLWLVFDLLSGGDLGKCGVKEHL